jgi:hypothetical protein
MAVAAPSTGTPTEAALKPPLGHDDATVLYEKSGCCAEIVTMKEK